MEYALIALVILAGVLAPADPGVLEGVQARRVRNGWGLSEPAGPGVVLVAVEDCEHLGRDGWLVAGDESRRVRVVDCQNRDERPRLSELGLVADVSEPTLGHLEGTIVLWQ